MPFFEIRQYPIRPGKMDEWIDFMQTENQRGIFGDQGKRNLYDGEDLDVPTYLRKGIKIDV